MFSKSCHNFPSWKFSLLCLFLSTNFSSTYTQNFMECIDTFNDFQLHKWTAYPPNGFLYVGNSDEILDANLQGKLDGEGIFYFPIGEGFTSSFLKPQEYFEDIRPMFMYVKYYSHVQDTNTSRAFGQPSLNPDSGTAEYFVSTSDFKWVEVLFEVDVAILKGFYLERLNIVANKFAPGDYFLVDRMIVSQGVNHTGIEDMKEHCGWLNEPTTTTTTTLRPTTTSPGFSCEAEGSFADPEDCAIFHVCQPNGAGGFTDDKLKCPVNTVWCQEGLRCESNDLCPCTIQDLF